MTYDAKCYALAVAFMEDHKHLTSHASRTMELAQEIQSLIDGVIGEYEDQDNEAVYQAEYKKWREAQETQEDPDDPRSQEYAERMYEAADMERKRIREEG